MKNKSFTQKSTSAMLLPLLACLLLLLTQYTAHAQYSNVPLTSGSFNSDQVANGTGSVSTSITAYGEVDGGGGTNGITSNYVFIDGTYKATSSCTASAAGSGIWPANSQINSTAAPGLTYIVQSATGFNACRIPAPSSANTTSSGTGSANLHFQSGVVAGNLYILATDGSGATTAGITFTVVFTDSSTQVFSNNNGANWCSAANSGIATVVTNGGNGSGEYYRIQSSVTTTCSSQALCQSLYDYTLTLSASNYSKTVAYINVNKTVATGIFNVYAVGSLAPCVTPSAAASISVNAGGASNIVTTITPPGTAPTGYMILRTTTNTAPNVPTNGTTYTASATLNGALNAYVDYVGTGTSFTSTGLTSNTTYYYWVYSYNSICAGAPYYSASAATGNTTTPACAGNSGPIQVGASESFTTLTAAIAYLYNNGLTGATVLELEGDYAPSGETFPIVIPAFPCASSINTVTIRPGTAWTSSSPLIISSAVSTTNSPGSATGTFTFSGASYVTIDGRPGGITANGVGLSIRNTVTTSSPQGVAIDYINDAQYNTVTYCDVEGEDISTSSQYPSGIIYFGTGIATGNSNNTISYCNVHSYKGVNVALGIVSYGTTTSSAIYNSNCTVTNCNIYNIFYAAGASYGIATNGGTSGWTITNNSIYDTLTYTYTSGTSQYGMYIGGTSPAGGFTISNNYIGGGAPNAFTGTGTAPGALSTYTMAGSVGTTFYGIYATLGGTTPSSIQGNTINNINLTSTGTGTVFVGIYTTGVEPMNIGTTTGNIIGSTSAAGSATNGIYVSGGSACSTYGIQIASTSTASATTVSNNTIAGFKVFTPTSTNAANFTGLYVSGSNTTLVLHANTIGSNTVTNSINASNAATNAQSVYGINITTGTTTTVSNNIIANLNNGYTSTSTGYMRGISITSSSTTYITSNTIRNLSSASTYTGTSTAGAIVGIMMNTSNPAYVNGNSIDSLINTSASTTAVSSLYGIVFGSNGAATAYSLSGNFIHHLDYAAVNTAATVMGVWVIGGSATMANNMIDLGTSVTGGTISTTAMKIYGFYFPANTYENIYFNSVYIGGSGVGTTASNTICFYKNVALTGTNAYDIKDNIFDNARSNATTGGTHYCIYYLTSGSGTTPNYNAYNYPGTGGVFAYSGTANVATYAANWGSTTDANSVTGDPDFIAPLGTPSGAGIANLAISVPPATTTVEGVGIAESTVTTDYFGNIRANYTPTDIGADAGNFNSSLIAACNLTSVTVTAVSTVTTSCPNNTVSNLSLTGVPTGYGYSYQWQSSPTGLNTFTNISGANFNTYTATASTATDYQCVVTCSAGGTATSSIVTLSVAGALTLPYSQGFNTSPLSANCWSSQNVTGTSLSTSIVTTGTTYDNPSFSVITVSPSEGTDLLQINTISGTSGNQIRVISPAFNTSAYPTGLVMQYDLNKGYSYYGYNDGTGYQSTVQPQYSTDGVNWTSIGSAVYNYSATPGWYTQTVTLPNGFSGQNTVYFAFLVTAPTSPNTTYENNMMLDNVQFLGICSGTPTVGSADGFTPLALTSGSYNAEVIASGAGGISSKIGGGVTWNIDGGSNTGSIASGSTGYNFFDASYTFNGAHDVISGTAYSLPLNGQILSSDISGLVYQLISHSSGTGNNDVLQLRYGLQMSANLRPSVPIQTTALYLLGVTGNGPGTITATVKFADSTSQTFTGLTVNDWFNATPYAQAGFDRVNNSGFAGAAPGNPRMYDIALTLSPANYSKTISYINVLNTYAGTSANTNVVNIFAVSYATPTPANFCASGLGTSVTLFNPPSGVSGITYQWQSSTTNGGPYTNVSGGSGANSTTYTTSATGTIYYVCDITCANSGQSVVSNQVTVTVNPAVTVSVSPATATYCVGQTPITLTATASGATVYSWSAATGLNNYTASVVQASPTTSTTWTLTTVGAGGCTSSATAAITAVAGITVTSLSATPPYTCGSNSSQLVFTSTGATAYSWSPSATLNNSTSSTVTATPLNTSVVYTVTASNTGCSLTDTIRVTNGATLASNPTPTPAITGHACAGTTYSLNANVTGGGGPYTYSWSSSPAGFTATTATVSVSPTVTTTYSVLVTDNCSNTTTGTYIFTPAAPPTTIIGSASYYCSTSNGDTLKVTGTATSFTWSPSTSLSATTGSSVVSTPTSGVTYTVTGSDGFCTSTAVTTVTKVSPPVISSVTASPANICAGGTTQLTANVNTSNSYSYCQPPIVNNAGYGCADEFVDDFSIAPSPSGTNVLSNQEQAGCVLNGIQYNDLGTTYTSGGLVAGNQYTATITNFVDEYVTWTMWIDYNQDGIFESNEQIFQYNTADAATTYSYTFTVPTSALTGTSKVRVRADWFATPSAGCDAYNQGTGETQDYTINITGGVSVGTFAWTPGSTLNDSIIYNPIATPTATTTYSVTASYGGVCPSSSSIAVNIAPLSVSTSSALAPPSNYCTPSYTTGTGAGDYLTNVTLGSINNTTSALPSPYYQYYSSLNTNLAAGSNYTITGTIDNGGTEDVAVWIDYNQDGIFESSEKLGEQASLSFSIPFTVPVTAVSGVTRMRVRNVYFTTGIDPCASYTYGDVQDYNVTITGGASADCGGTAQFQITSTITGGGQPYTYSWAPSTGLSSSTVANPIANPSVTTTYTLTVNDNCSNVQSSNTTITVITPPTVSASVGSQNVCLGSSTSITASGADTYTWAPVATVNNSTGTTVSATPTATTTYTVTGVSTASGCSATDTFSIHSLIPPTSISATASPSFICSAGTPATLTASSLVGGYAGAAGWKYKWTDTSGNVLQAYSTSPSYTVTPPIAGTYYYDVYASPSACPSLASPGSMVSFSEGISGTLTGTNPTTCGPTGVITIGSQVGLKSWYKNNFNTSSTYGATLYGNAAITGDLLYLTTATNSETGYFSVPNPGINSVPLSVDFNLVVNGYGTNTPANGLSYSFAPDAYPNNTITLDADNGSGSKLKIAFETYAQTTESKGIYLDYNCNVNEPSPTASGVLAFSSYTGWMGTTSHVNVTINNLGQLTLTVGGQIIFYNVQLPTDYITSNKSTWTHVFAARTGGLNENNAIGDLNIQYGGFQYSYNTTNGLNGTWSNSTSFTGLNAGTYTVWMRNAADSTCNIDLGHTTLTSPTAPHATLISSTPAYCSGTSSPLTIGLTNSVAPYRTYNVQSNNTAYNLGTASGSTISAPLFINAPGLLASQLDSVIFSLSPTGGTDNSYQIYLIAPNGSQITVWNQDASGSGYNFDNTVLTNAAGAIAFSAGSNPFTGQFLPDQAFSNLTGNASGTWYLKIVNASGTLNANILTGFAIHYKVNNVNYTWTPSTTLSSSTIYNPAASPTVNTTYVLTLADSSTSCHTIDTVKFAVNPLPTVKFSPFSNLVVCTGPVAMPITLTGTSPWTLVYNDGTNHTLNATTASYVLNAYPLATTVYQIRSVTDHNGCVASAIGSSANAYADSARTVTLYAPTGGSVTPALSTICNGSNQTFSVAGYSGTNIQWQYSTNPNSVSWTNYGTYDSTSATLSNVTSLTYVRAVISTPGCVSVASTDGEVKLDSSAITVGISNISATAATVNWTPALGATSYTIVYNGNTVVAGNVTSYNLTGLSSCTAYSVSVTSNTSNCGGARSGSGSFNTPTGNLSLSLSQGVTYKVTATWNAGVGPYKLYIGSAANLNSLQVFNVTGTTYTTTNAWPGYTVAAYVVDLGSTCTPLAQSPMKQINVAGGSCTTGAPVITARATTATTFTVQWSGSATGYQFYYKNTNGSGSWYSYYTAGNSMTINGCAPGNCYAVYVQNVCGTTKGYATAIDTLCTAAVCGAPLNLILSKATCNGFTATWNSVAGATAYQVFMTVTAASGSPIVYSYTVTGSPYTVAIFGRSVPVTVYVKTLNCNGSNGISAASNVESITTLATACKDDGSIGSNDAGVSAAIANGTFSIYPNPNNGTFKVSMATLSTNSVATLEVMDLLGRTLYTKEVSNNNGTIVETIDMGNAISSGLYMVRVRCGNDTHITKVQIQR